MLFDTKRKSLSHGSPVFISTRKFLPVKRNPVIKLTYGLEVSPNFSYGYSHGIYLNNSLLTRCYVNAGTYINKNAVFLRLVFTSDGVGVGVVVGVIRELMT